MIESEYGVDHLVLLPLGQLFVQRQSDKGLRSHFGHGALTWPTAKAFADERHMQWLVVKDCKDAAIPQVRDKGVTDRSGGQPKVEDMCRVLVSRG